MELAVADSLGATPQPFVDGFGERRLVTSSRGERLDVLRLTLSLSANRPFVAAVRDRVAQLGSFGHDAFVRTRSVEYDEPSGASFVISDYVRGVRLSTLLATAEKRSIPFDLGAARALIRQLVRASASWRELMPDFVHGAIAPERIIVTPGGRLLLADHVFGSALEQLKHSRERLWEEFRVVVPQSPAGVDNATADVMQVGAVALALVLGRPLRNEEFRDGFEQALTVSDGGPGTPLDSLPALRVWLRRTLQVEKGTAFVSILDAKPSLYDALGDANPGAEQNAIQAFVAKCLVLDGGLVSGDAPARQAAAHLTNEGKPDPDTDPADQIDSVEDEADALPMFAPEQSGRVAVDETLADVALPLTLPPPEPTPVTPVQDSRNQRLWTTAALAVIVVALGATLLVLRNRSLTPVESTGTLTIVTNPAGATVSLDGAPRGISPLDLDVAPGQHVVELVSGGLRRTIPVTIRAGSQVSQFIELSAPQTSTGQLLVRTEPPSARVTVDGQFVGESPASVEDLAPGSHTVLLQHAAGSVTERVLIEAGKTASLVVPLAPRNPGTGAGWISVTAPVDVQIFESGRLLGSSRVERIMMPAGNYDLEIVQDQLGFRQLRSVRVTPGQVARLDVTWPTGTLAINAIPWAEVFVDGNAVGETPIGGLQLPIGTHEVVFRHPQFGEQRTRVTVTVGQTAKVGVDMRTSK